MQDNDTRTPDSIDDASSLARREFLEKAGKLAAYTPPTMLALMYPGAHAVASGGVTGGGSGSTQDPIPLPPRVAAELGVTASQWAGWPRWLQEILARWTA